MNQFIKMHGLGNDFVIFDGRDGSLSLSAAAIQSIADRRLGIGCDQVIILTAPKDPENTAFMRIYNAGGTETNACGNAARCVGWLLSDVVAKLETAAGVLTVDNMGENSATAHMGQMQFDWQQIPLSRHCDTTDVDLQIPGLPNAACAGIGNPHAVFFMDDVDIDRYGPLIEKHPLFPQRTNAEFVQVIDRERLRIRVWERDVGETLACGTGACAAVAIAHKRGLVNNKCHAIFRGGTLVIDLDSDYNVKITGEVAVSFIGQLKLIC